MKRILVVLCFIIGCVILPGNLLAQVDNLSNMSPDWVRLANRNAATDAVDIVVYNPAGLTKLADGFHINIGNQSLIRKPEHSFDLGMGSMTYSQDGIDAIIPNLYMAYKKKNWSIFGGLYIPGGGAVADYPDGSITTKLLGMGITQLFPGVYNYFVDDWLEATSIYLTGTIGGAYAFNDTISVAVALRYITAKNNVKGGLTLTNIFSSGIPDAPLELDADMTANGAGVVFGVNISPGDKLNIGLRYESKVKLDFEAEVKADGFAGTVVVDGEKKRRDFPALLGFGLSYRFTPKIRAEFDFNYCFQKQADWGMIFTPTGLKDYSELAGDCWSFGAGIAYAATEKLELSCGLLYTILDFQDMNTYYTNLGTFEVLFSDNLFIGTGFKWQASKHVALSAAGAIILWKSHTINVLAAYPMDL
ncbi:MAG: hypothetical protein GY765_41820, partial [bacterium]|nr:hypothetical protein [bacterium]